MAYSKKVIDKFEKTLKEPEKNRCWKMGSI